MKRLEDKILSVMQKHRMITVGDTVVVGVSGGADSMCLLSFFNTISSEYRLNIICAHVNHGIRGKEADRDEEFVRSFCIDNNIRFECTHYDIPAISRQTGESEEQCGRRLRYEFFSSFGSDVKIATAHNLNDCEETFLFNLARGTGLRGLTGIPPVRDNIIRPLIDCTRAEIEGYLEEKGLSFVTDSTNLSDDYSRNKLRHNVLPLLSDINPSFHSAFANCISVLSEADSFISEEVTKAFENARADDRFLISYILTLHDAVRNRLLIEIASFYGASDVSAKHVSLIDDVMRNGGAVMLCGGITVASDGTYIYKASSVPDEPEIYVPYEEMCEKYSFPGGTVSVVRVDKRDIKEYNIKRLSENGIADSDKIRGAVFRSRREGDRFRFPRREHSKSLKNLFNENNITPDDRYGVPFLADDEHILWIHGAGVSHYAAVDEDTKEYVKIIFMRGS